MYSKRDLNNEARRQYSQKVSRRESDFSEWGFQIEMKDEN